MQGFIKNDPSVSNKSQGIDQGNPVAEFFPGEKKNRGTKRMIDIITGRRMMVSDQLPVSWKKKPVSS